jgi:hypothetical protein
VFILSFQLIAEILVLSVQYGKAAQVRLKFKTNVEGGRVESWRESYFDITEAAHAISFVVRLLKKLPLPFSVSATVSLRDMPVAN